eukprot:gene1268-4118_t
MVRVGDCEATSATWAPASTRGPDATQAGCRCKETWTVSNATCTTNRGPHSGCGMYPP